MDILSYYHSVIRIARSSPTIISENTLPSPSKPLGTRIIHGTISGLGITILANGFLFIGQLIIPRALTHSEYAQYTVSISFVAVLALLADLGMSSMFTKEFAEAEEVMLLGGGDRRGELLGSAFLLRLMLSVFVAVLALSIAPTLYPANMVSNIAIVLLSLFISSRLLVFRSVGESLLRSRGKYYLVASFALLDALGFAIILFATRSEALSVQDILWIYVLCNLPGFLLLMVSIFRWRRQERIHITPKLSTMLKFLRAALPLSIATGFLTIHTEADKLLLDRLSTPNEVASFGAMVRLMAAVIPVPMVLAAVAGPELTRLLQREDRERARQLTGLSLRILLASAGAIAVFVIPASTEIASFFLGKTYAASGYLLEYIGFMLLPVFVSTFLMEMSIASGRFWPATAYTAFLMVSVITGDLLLIPSLGAAGAMTSKLISVTLGCAVLILALRNTEFLDRRSLANIIFRVACCIATIALAYAFCSQMRFGPLLESVLLVFLYAFSLLAFRVLSISDLHEQWARVRGGRS